MARRTDRKHVIKDGMVPLPSLTRFRSFACLERHELGIISGSGNECVPRTRRLTPFCLRFRAWASWRTCGFPIVQAPLRRLMVLVNDVEQFLPYLVCDLSWTNIHVGIVNGRATGCTSVKNPLQNHSLLNKKSKW